MVYYNTSHTTYIFNNKLFSSIFFFFTTKHRKYFLNLWIFSGYQNGNKKKNFPRHPTVTPMYVPITWYTLPVTSLRFALVCNTFYTPFITYTIIIKTITQKTRNNYYSNYYCYYYCGNHRSGTRLVFP